MQTTTEATKDLYLICSNAPLHLSPIQKPSNMGSALAYQDQNNVNNLVYSSYCSKQSRSFGITCNWMSFSIEHQTTG